MEIKEELKNWWEENGKPAICNAEYKYRECGKPLGIISKHNFRAWIKEFRYGLIDSEIIDKNAQLQAKVQKYVDTNRIERKSFREFARISNALEDYNLKLIELLTKYNLKIINKTKPSKINSKSAGIIQLSDVHFNELIELDSNKYDFEIASKRFKLLCDRAKVYFKASNIQTVLIAITGDLMNSDRRLDELLNQATNRAKATLLAFRILEQFIADLAHDFKVCVTCVSGNESRAGKELGFSEIMATDNYDFTIFNMLKIAYRNCEQVEFIDGAYSEKVVNIAGQNVLLMHGLAIKSDIERSIQQTIGKYASKGVIVDYVLIGHIHSCRIGDFYARSSGMCGSNSYSDNALNLASRASQNIGIFYDNKSRDVIKIDLQETQGINGYDIIKELEAYNSKAANKSVDKVKVYEVII